MPEIQKGEPLGLAVYPALCFLDLPREIRDRIYFDALNSRRPITVSFVTIQEHRPKQNEANQTIVSRAYTIEGQDPILQEIAMSLLWCHPAIAIEAATCFYQSNTFHFGGNEVWNPLYSFLERIGGYNRSLLRKLSVEMETPKQTLQNKYGTRMHFGVELPFYIVHSSASGPLPQIQPPREIETEYSAFAYLNPAIQACFRLLGSDGSRLVLTLEQKNFDISGTSMSTGQYPSNMSLPDLPNFVESLRREFAARVEVLWNGFHSRSWFVREMGAIQDGGWDIIETRERHVSCDLFPPRRPWPQRHDIIYFTLRRRAVEAAQRPPTFCENCYTERLDDPTRVFAPDIN